MINFTYQCHVSMFRTADDSFSPSIASSGKNWRRLERREKERGEGGREGGREREKREERERESKEGERMEEGKGFNTTTVATISFY